MKSKETKDTEEILDEVCALFEEKYKNSDALTDLKTTKKRSERVEEEAKGFIEQVLKKKEGCTGEDVLLISGQKFPDITLFKTQGIEVKTAHKSWKTPGNSVQEGTRIDDVEVIFVLYVNIKAGSVECRTGLYEDYVSDFEFTHNPRYKIDMELKPGDSIFEKIGTTYSEFRSHDEPRSLVARYYYENCEDGERPWFSPDPNFVSPPTIKTWSSLGAKKKKKLEAEMYARFPEVIGTSKHKYTGVGVWLIKHHGIFNHALRDLFSAGGEVNLEISGEGFNNVPQCFSKLNEKMKDIIKFLQSNRGEWDQTSWSYRFEDGNIPAAVWKEKVVQHCDEKHRKLLKAIINSHCD